MRPSPAVRRECLWSQQERLTDRPKWNFTLGKFLLQTGLLGQARGLAMLVFRGHTLRPVSQVKEVLFTNKPLLPSQVELLLGKGADGAFRWDHGGRGGRGGGPGGGRWP